LRSSASSRARVDLGLGAGDEGRADHAAHLLERGLVRREGDDQQRIRDHRILGQRNAERDVERHRDRLARDEMVGTKDIREDPLHARAARGKIGHDDSDSGCTRSHALVFTGARGRGRFLLEP